MQNAEKVDAKGQQSVEILKGKKKSFLLRVEILLFCSPPHKHQPSNEIRRRKCSSLLVAIVKFNAALPLSDIQRVCVCENK